MTETTQIVARPKFSGAGFTLRCPICGDSYSVWLGIGSSKNHCSKWECRLEHGRIARERDNQRRRGQV